MAHKTLSKDDTIFITNRIRSSQISYSDGWDTNVIYE